MKFEQTITEPVDIHYNFIANSDKLIEIYRVEYLDQSK
jgi:hypothetical protein